MTNLLEVIKDQSAFGFTGKINLLLASTSQFQGVVYLHEGILVGSQFGVLKGKIALFKMIFEDVESSEYFKFVVEPEFVDRSFFSLKMTYDEARLEAQGLYQKYINAKKFKPALDLRLAVDPEIIINQEIITADEFDILSILTEWCLVSDVYKYSRLMEFEVTNTLVRLRKKRAIKVFQS